jgi:hypothetical protein
LRRRPAAKTAGTEALPFGTDVRAQAHIVCGVYANGGIIYAATDGGMGCTSLTPRRL